MTSHTLQDERIGYRLRLAHARVHAAYSAVLAQYGLLVPGYAVMRLLDRQPGRSQAQIARMVGMTPQAMSEVVSAHLTAGRIERRPAPSGGRVFELRLTPSGRRTLRAADRRLDALDAELLDDEDSTALAALLERLAPLPPL